MTMLPILVMFALAALVCLLLLGLSRFVGPRRPTPVKDAPFECGMEQISTPRRQMAIKFSVVAMLFIIFDIEVAFLYPWAVLFWDLKWFGLIQIGIFTLLLIESYVYVWKKGALEWE